MAGLYDEFDRMLVGLGRPTNGHGFMADAGGERTTVEFLRSQADDGTPSIRMLVDGLDLFYVDEDGAMGVYEHPFSWMAMHEKGA